VILDFIVEATMKASRGLNIAFPSRTESHYTSVHRYNEELFTLCG